MLGPLIMALTDFKERPHIISNPCEAAAAHTSRCVIRRHNLTLFGHISYVPGAL